MTRIYTAVHVDIPQGELFNFVTTPGNWPRWHPSSLGVQGATDHSLAIGEEVTESFRVAGREGEALWRVVERDEPRRWVIEGRVIGRDAGGKLTYTLRPNGNGTLFQREFTYPVPTLFYTFMDRLWVRRRVQNEAQLAVLQLKSLLEQDAAANGLNTNSYYFLNEWTVPDEIDEVWPFIVNGTGYPHWWGMFIEQVTALNDLNADQVGAKAALVARGRLPYRICLTSEVTQVAAPEMLSIKVHGDLSGIGTWRLTPSAKGTFITFEWIVWADRLLRLLSPLVKPRLEGNYRGTRRQNENALQKLMRRSKEPERQATRSAARPVA